MGGPFSGGVQWAKYYYPLIYRQGLDMGFEANNTYGVHKGRPKGSKDFLPELLKAIKRAERSGKPKLMDRFVEMAYEDSKVMVSLMKKLVADKKDLEVTGGLSGNFRVVIDKDNIKYPATAIASGDIEETGTEASGSST